MPDAQSLANKYLFQNPEFFLVSRQKMFKHKYIVPNRDKKITQPIRIKKKLPNLSGQKKSPNLSGQTKNNPTSPLKKNHPTSCDKKKITQPLGTQ